MCILSTINRSNCGEAFCAKRISKSVILCSRPFANIHVVCLQSKSTWQLKVNMWFSVAEIFFIVFMNEFYSVMNWPMPFLPLTDVWIYSHESIKFREMGIMNFDLKIGSKILSITNIDFPPAVNRTDSNARHIHISQECSWLLRHPSISSTFEYHVAYSKTIISNAILDRLLVFFFIYFFK